MTWQVVRVTADTWSAVLWLTPTIYARASRHRSAAAAARACARLNAALERAPRDGRQFPLPLPLPNAPRHAKED